jgi:hypothetical protein
MTCIPNDEARGKTCLSGNGEGALGAWDSRLVGGGRSINGGEVHERVYGADGRPLTILIFD